ncbi:hypothetical protein PCE1_001812 [Barthelona sp. PCE]
MQKKLVLLILCSMLMFSTALRSKKHVKASILGHTCKQSLLVRFEPLPKFENRFLLATDGLLTASTQNNLYFIQGSLPEHITCESLEGNAIKQMDLGATGLLEIHMDDFISKDRSDYVFVFVTIRNPDSMVTMVDFIAESSYYVKNQPLGGTYFYIYQFDIIFFLIFAAMYVFILLREKFSKIRTLLMQLFRVASIVLVVAFFAMLLYCLYMKEIGYDSALLYYVALFLLFNSFVSVVCYLLFVSRGYDFRTSNMFSDAEKMRLKKYCVIIFGIYNLFFIFMQLEDNHDDLSIFSTAFSKVVWVFTLLLYFLYLRMINLSVERSNTFPRFLINTFFICCFLITMCCFKEIVIPYYAQRRIIFLLYSLFIFIFFLYQILYIEKEQAIESGYSDL